MTSELEQRVGGKAAQLAHVRDLGCSVPNWFCIDVDEFNAALDQRDVRAARSRAEELVSQGELVQAARAMRSAVVALPFSDELRESIIARWRDEFVQDSSSSHPLAVAVRSSAIGEDGTEHSFAGQFESVLGIVNEDQLLDAIRTCWASGWTERAVVYRAKAGLDPLDAHMGIIVQRLIDADIAGVMFTADPTNGDPLTTVISATWGLGEALVSGVANADTFRLDRRHQAIDASIADKDIMIERSEAGLTVESAVEPEQRLAQTLTDEQVRELTKIGNQLARGCGDVAQDVEWAIHEGKLFILQTRPITTKLRPPGIRRTWDNSNIVESYSGVVSPLTFSFAREAYTAVYFQALKLLRLPASEMRHARVIVRQMLGYLDGRVFYNLASWYYLLSVMPNYEKNASAMEQMMGVRAPLDSRVAPPARTGRKLRLYASIGWLLLTVNRRVRTFRGSVQRVLNQYNDDFSAMDADQLVNAYDQLRTELLDDWQTPIVGDTRVMIMFDRLRSTIRNLGLDDSGTLHNDLMCGQGGLESAEPTYMLVRIAERIRPNDVLRSALFDTPDENVHTVFRELDTPDSRWVDAQLSEYLDRFGDRCANELKLETPTLREHPAFLFSVLRNYVRQENLTVDSMSRQEAELASNALTTVARSFDLSRSWLTPLHRRRFNFTLRQARAAVRDREAMRFDRTRVFGLARRIFTALGEQFHAAGLLDTPRDIFMLEVDEIIGTVQGTTTITDLRGLVLLRKTQCERWESHELPDRIETIGITNANPRDDAYASVDVTGDSLTGIGCCPGIVEQPVRVVLSPAAGVDLSGDIMVCTRTDPGWVPLFPSCGGLLVERGSLLSHSAIVAREFGIPAIVGIPGLMSWALDGEQVRMDGSTGVVERL